MLGSTAPYDYVHTFWSDQYEHTIEYVGHVTKWDEFVVRGSVEEGKLSASTWWTGWCGPHRARPGR
jgi:hypothetical protein